MNNLPPLNTRRESFADGLTVRVDEGGSGRPILVLHGGGGPQTMYDLSQVLAKHAHVLLPTHPGFEGEPRPEWVNSIDDLALTYLDLLERLDLHDVLIVGSSMGGWIASTMAVRDASRLAGLVLIDAVGIQVDGHPIADASTLTPEGLAALTFHNPAAFRVNPATVTPEQANTRKANIQALYVYDQGLGMSDPKLRRRLRHVSIPILVVWGESDGVADPEYGRAYAQSFLNARFQLISEAGHLPQIEQPIRLLTPVLEFADSVSSAGRRIARDVSVIPDLNKQGESKERAIATLTITRIAHSTVLIDFDGYRVLTDPWFSEEEGFYHGEPYGMPLQYLPRLDGVVVSHEHYDHYDMQAFQAYPDKQVPIAVVRGTAQPAREVGFTNVIEMVPWETTSFGPITVTAIPGEHGVPEITYMLQAGNFTVYFGGDTLLIPAFDEIPQRFPKVDVALLSINGLQLRQLNNKQVVMNPQARASG